MQAITTTRTRERRTQQRQWYLRCHDCHGIFVRFVPGVRPRNGDVVMAEQIVGDYKNGDIPPCESCGVIMYGATGSDVYELRR